MDASPIFTPEFLATDPEHAHRTIEENGYWICEKGLDPSLAAALDKDLDARPLALNVNDVGPVRFHHQTYFTHALAGSRAFFDLVTNAHLRRICRAHLGPDFRLKCQRYYQSARHHALTWHTDDKSPLGVHTGVAGVGVVMYLQDTYEGELQVLRGSHKWSATSGKTEFTDDDVRANYAESIVTISLPAGAVIVFDSSTLHRTRPILKRGFVRRSVFLQVDADMQHSEKIIVDTQYLDPHDHELLRYLGVGLPSGYPAMPPSNVSTLTDSDLTKLALRSVGTLALRKLAAPPWRALRATWRMVKRS